MSLSLHIVFNDPKRAQVYHPLAFQEVLRRSWWPLAQRLGLPLLQKLECLFISTRQEAESILREFEVVRGALGQPDHGGISQGDAAYMLRRLSEVEPLIMEAVQEWDHVDHLSL